jgi:hypothetical protein
MPKVFYLVTQQDFVSGHEPIAVIEVQQYHPDVWAKFKEDLELALLEHYQFVNTSISLNIPLLWGDIVLGLETGEPFSLSFTHKFKNGKAACTYYLDFQRIFIYPEPK